MRADWFQSTCELTCGSCGLQFARGALLRRLRTDGIRCAACAKRLLGEDAPDLTQPVLAATPTPAVRPVQPFTTPVAFVDRLRRWLDVKRRQSGDLA